VNLQQVFRLRLLLLLCFFLSGTAAGLHAQTPGNLRSRILAPADTLRLDTLSIIPETFVLRLGADTVPASCYNLNAAAAYIVLRPCAPRTDSLRISYRVFPVYFAATARRKDPVQLTAPPGRSINPFVYKPGEQKRDDIFAMNGLNKSGSLARGISFGNNRDVSVNSSLNLQLSGRLTDNIELTMAATDDNLPIQPDGTTQQLQEFDRVYIQLAGKGTRLIAGDFFTTRPAGYFMNYSKRGQGLYVTTRQRLGNTASADSLNQPLLLVTGGAAISKGKFARNIVQGIEGNQGPYRLRGAENELFIVVLSGTEKVFVDGQLLVRGQENDYIIDYNTSEIIFTAKQLITKDKRIVVEFQYTDRNYARSLLLAGAEYRTQRWGVRLQAFSEQDSRNQPLQQTLTDVDKLTLTQVGDTLLQAVVPGADSVGFSNDVVLYRQTDTLVNAVLYPDVFVFSTDAAVAHWRVTFSFVGAGRGNYRQINASANGKVFEWVAPVGNQPQGEYEPVILLVTPKQRQLVTFGADHRTKKNAVFSAEAAYSNNDLNTFSAANSNDDKGYGFFLRGADTLKLRDSLRLLADASAEVVSRYFTPVERYRAVEFERDWNRGFQNAGGAGWQNTSGSALSLAAAAGQQLAQGGMQLQRLGFGMAGYRFGMFLEGSNYTGFRHALNTTVARGGFRLSADGSLLTSTGAVGATEFLRHKVAVQQIVAKKWLIAAREQTETSRVQKPQSDSLQASSFGYFEWEVRAGTADSTLRAFQLFYSRRTDNLPTSLALKQAAIAENRGGTFSLKQNPNQQIRLTLNWRTLRITDTILAPQKPENTLLGRFEYNARFWKGIVTANTFYEAGSGLEVRREFSYLEVPVGQGTYTWTDYNGNGVKELNEFEIAVFTDQASYIRIYTPTNQFIRVYTNQFTQSINVRPAVRWANEKKFKGFMARLSDQFVYRVERKTTSSDAAVALVPRLDDANDAELVSLSASVRNTFFFNQLSSKFGADFSVQDIRSKTLLTNGLESRGNTSREFRVRWNITRALLLSTEAKEGVKTNSSQFFSTRNFSIRYYEVAPQFSVQPGTTFRLSIGYRYAQKQNAPGFGNESLFLNKLSTEVKYNVLSKGSLNAELAWISMNYNGSATSAVAWDMLEALKPGQNYTWRVNWQRALANNLQLTLGYEGRKSDATKAIHTGSAQIRAMF
jgi:hypothetical protein